MISTIIRNTHNEPIIIIENQVIKFAPCAKDLRENFKLQGIPIQESLQDNFQNRKIIYYNNGDSLFTKAFLEIYLPRLKQQGFTAVAGSLDQPKLEQYGPFET